MNRFKNYSQLTCCIALLLTAFVAGCGGSNGNGGSPAPAATDTTAPTVKSTNPANAAVGVPINRKLTAVFSEAMDPTTITAATFSVTDAGATLVPGTVTYVAGGITAIFTPASNLGASTAYTATITTGAKDLAGNALASNKVWTFTTGTATDAGAPTVSSTQPVASATGVATNANITAIFHEAMDPATINTATFTLTGPGATPVSGVVTYTGTTAILNPTGDLASGTAYTATVTTGAMDLAGNALASAMVWSFTTGAAPAAGPAPVVLGTSGNFAILSKSGITNVPTSAVTGDVGTSPITGAANGLTCAQVTGTIYSVDAAGPAPCSVVDPTGLTTAVGNMETAYTDATGRAADVTELGAGNISGLTLAPGVYKWGTGLLIATDVILSGGANDVWIFQIAQDLTVSNGVTVTLSGGALPKNIFWQVAGQAVLGTTSNFKGIILSQTAIVLQTGAVMNGRALAQTAVTLDASTVTRPAP